MKREYKYLSDEELHDKKEKHNNEIWNLIEKIEKRYNIEINQDDLDNITSLVLRKKWWLELHHETNIRLLEKSFTFRLKRKLYTHFLKKKVTDIKNYLSKQIRRIVIRK